MRQGIKRPIKAYIFHGLWIAMAISWSTMNSSEMGRWILWIGATGVMISLIDMTLKRNYFEIADKKLIINDSLFRTKIIDLGKIEKFVIESGPFTKSRIILKDVLTPYKTGHESENRFITVKLGKYVKRKKIIHT